MLRVSADLESRANSLRKEALQCITVALAGSNTHQFWSLMMAYFGANHTGTDDDPWDFLDAAPKIPDPLPVTDTETEDEAASVQSAPAGAISFVAAAARDPVGIGAKVRVATKGGRGRGRGIGLPDESPRKPLVPQFKDDLVDVCSIGEAICMYPADESTLNETGVPKELQVECQAKTSLSGASIYLCRHPKCQEHPFHAQSEAGIYSHIRRKHLGIVVACPYCVKKLFWNTKGWRSHMEHNHREAPWYGSALRAESQEASELLQQLSTNPLAVEKAMQQQEKHYRKATRPKCHPQAASPRPGKEEVKGEPDDSSLDSDYAPPSKEDTSNSSSDSSGSDNDDPPQGKPRKGSRRPESKKETSAALIEDEEVDPDSLKDMPPLEDVAPPAFPRGAPPRKRHCQEDA